MALVDRLTAMNARLKRLPSHLGVPQYQPVVLELGKTQTLLVPNPKVEMTKPGTGEAYLGTNNVHPHDEFYWVRGIPRTVPDSLVSRAYYLLNAVEAIPNTGVYKGLRCQVVYVNRNDLLEYSTLVQVLRTR